MPNILDQGSKKNIFPDSVPDLEQMGDQNLDIGLIYCYKGN
jgi:hypothetical protein